jgi:hypothetical protein
VTDKASIPTPSLTEIEYLAALWGAQEEGIPALKSSDIQQRVSRRREQRSEAAHAGSTASTILRNATRKGLLEEVSLQPLGVAGKSLKRATSGKPRTRSPLTAYRPSYTPTQVFEQLFRTISFAYPPKKRVLLLLDVARALDLPRKTVMQIEKLLER